ncbi:gamma-glutamylcyclotransferase [Marinomonas sp. C2222]|uniref:Gamma-glutamylcyclotransferase n=1 Tax=Marinomonas sargassi TaxID=2984494 RepID=A0ABT2YQ09_9GAMM|nr:gamma-glutamylcyclotransferase family protein [Marinomonas sargassi]MCV2401981.1 gamma-glutamylcyclotransferase [Marinomonas sargassi]
MSTQSRHFILGYGSLISSESRAKTGETGQVWPVKLHGFERHWALISECYGMSSVAVVKAPEKSCNGVLIEVPYEQLPLFDEREKGYHRGEVRSDQLAKYQDTPLPEGTYWVYYTDKVVSPNANNPIVLSYLDVILSGCLEHGETFAQDFLDLTQGWHQTTLNDRQSPRYPRVQPDLDIAPLNALLTNTVTLTNKELDIHYEP